MLENPRAEKVIDEARITRLAGLLEALKDDVLGQDAAMEEEAAATIRGELGDDFALVSPDRPKVRLLKAGPTGVGKTESTNVEATHLWGSLDAIGRFDMSEYQTAQDIAPFKTIIGMEIDRLMAEFGGGILLFDEIEKAYKGIFQLLNGILDAGRIRMSDGALKNCAQFHIHATSNVGSEVIGEMEGMPYSTIRRWVEEQARETFTPWVLGRYSEVIVFQQLSEERQREICELMLNKHLGNISKAIGRVIDYTKPVLTFLIGKGYHRLLGARPMRNAIEREVGAAMAQWIFQRGYNWPGGEPLLLEPEGHRLGVKRLRSA